MNSVMLQGPSEIGAPVVRMQSSGPYNPDVIDDLARRAVDAYREAYGELAATHIDYMRSQVAAEATETAE